MSDSLRRAMFTRGVAAAARVLGEDTLARARAIGHYVCPICLRALPESALELNDGRRDLTLEDVPPVSFPGPSSKVALTCRWCNHTAGSRWESDLKTHGDLLESQRGIGSVRGTILEDDLALQATFNIDQRRLIVHRNTTNPTDFDAFVARHSTAQSEPSFRFRSAFRYDKSDASLALVKAGYVLAFARFGYTWAFARAVAPIRTLLVEGLSASPTGRSPAPETILRQPGGDLTTRRLIFMTRPVPALVVVLGENAVVLPYPGSPPDLGQAIAALPATRNGDFSIEEGHELPWPTGLALSLDFGEDLS